MPKIVDGSVVCRITYAPESTGRKFYCDHCGQTFDDRESPPCDRQVEDFIFPKRHESRGTLVEKLPAGEAYDGELSDNFEITGHIVVPTQKKVAGKKK